MGARAVYVLAKPAAGATYDPLAAAKREQEVKDKLLAAFDPLRKMANGGKDAEEDGDIYSNKTLFRVLNNIQVHAGSWARSLPIP